MIIFTYYSTDSSSFVNFIQVLARTHNLWKTHPGLVDNIDDADEFAFAGAICNEGHTPCLYKPLERLKRHQTSTQCQ